MASLNFDSTKHAPQQEFQPIPDDTMVDLMIVESELKPTSKGDGVRLVLVMQVQGGPYANRKIFTGLNIQNPNPTAVEIAYSELSAICHVTGVPQPQDSQQLHGIPFKGKIKLRPASGDYGASNEIKAYYDIHGNKPGSAGSQPPNGPAAPAGPAMPQQPQQPQQGYQQQPQQPQQQNWQAPQGQAPQGQYQPPQQEQAPQQYQQPPQQQAAPQRGYQQPQQGYQQPEQAYQPEQAAPQAPQTDPQQAAPQAPSAQEQGYTQPPQGGQAQPAPQGGQAPAQTPPWQR